MEKQKKVLFVVYRTEWWGCLDSYCRQECMAENTLCYVMPIPRYERDEVTLEANFEKKHFEPEKLAAMLPKGVCMVDCKEFSLEQGFERIYIHNPYDNGCILDTVEVKYYSLNLRKYTSRLICVSHFLNLPLSDYVRCNAYDYVDAIYIPFVSAKYALEEKYDEKVEVVPSGIPEYLDCLTEKMYARGDLAGDRMKLLYCISFSDLAIGMERQLQEMREVFEYARQNGNILLIFRPDEDIPVLRLHRQLSEAIWQKYEELIAYFVKNQIGIYDKSPDLYEVAVLADGILCTDHPMAGLFSVQGKYVLRLDRVHRPAPTTEDRCIPAMCIPAVEVKEDEIEVWFVPDKTKLICSMVIPGGANVDGARRCNVRKKVHKHLSGPKVEIITEVPDEIVGGLNYLSVIKTDDFLYLIPALSDGIWKCKLDTKEFSKQYLPKADGVYFNTVFTYGRYLYMIPRMYPGIVKYDTETEEIIVFGGWVEELDSYASQECQKEPYFVRAVKQEGNMLYMASAKCDVWMEFDMNTDTWFLKPMGLPGKRFAAMGKEGEWVWLFPFCGNKIVLWNCKTDEAQEIYETVDTEPRNIPYTLLLDRQDAVIAFPQQKTDHVLVIQKSNFLAQTQMGVQQREGQVFPGAGMGIQEVRDGLPCGYGANVTEYRKQFYGAYHFVKQLENGLILTYEYYDGSFLLLNRKLQVLRKVPCRLPIEAVRQQQDTIWKNDQYRGGFHGGIHAGYSIPVMIEYFIRHGRESREEIRRYYERYYPRGKEVCAKCLKKDE